MEPNGLFYEFLTKFIALSQADFKLIITPYLQVRKFKRKEAITAAGSIEGYFNFITSGLVRKYFKKDAEEINTQISTEGHIIHSQVSFHSQTPSDYTIEAVEACSLLSITYSDLNKIFSANAAMERMGRLIVIYVMVLNDRWQMTLLKLSPRERFVEFAQKNSGLMQRVPQKYLASLLNIQPETFSRFKHLLKASPPQSPDGGS
ncbi:MAG TPA: Crp/Fnr family transcriptional regulator [Flavisolibacter sp.]|nr:Crp/Fnr family transcriptional regulator [Flavisolibacter sp.]